MSEILDVSGFDPSVPDPDFRWVFRQPSYYLSGDANTTGQVFDSLKDFIRTLDSEIDGVLERERMLYQAQTAGGPDWLRENILAHRESDFRRYACYAMLLMTALTIESELNNFARVLAGELGLADGIDTLRGDLLTRMRTFLKKVARWYAYPPELAWQWLRDVMTLRNIIVHSAGSFCAGIGDRAENRCRSIAARRKGITFSSPPQSRYTTIDVSPVFCRASAEAARRFFVILYSPCWLRRWTRAQRARELSIYVTRTFSTEPPKRAKRLASRKPRRGSRS